MISNDAEIKDRILKKLFEDKDNVLGSIDFGAPIPEADEFSEIESEMELIAFLEELEKDGLIDLEFSKKTIFC